LSSLGITNHAEPFYKKLEQAVGFSCFELTTSAIMSEPEHPDRVKLREHFLAGNTADKWAELWKEDFLPWDRGVPNPALVDTLVQKKDFLGSSAKRLSDGSQRKKRAFVPGCGTGYDVLLLASYGYDAVGLDGSEKAVEAGRILAVGKLEPYPLQDGVDTRGSMTFVTDDFFSNSWESGLPFHPDFDGFDLIYDYTVRLPAKSHDRC
jgi:methyl halide transferase